MISAFDVKEALKTIVDPELKRNLVDLKMVRDIDIQDGHVKVTLALTTLGCPMKKKFVENVKEVVAKLPGVKSTEVEVTAMSREELDKLFPKHPLKGIERVSHFVAVASGKGGVGKTTVAVNLALALARENLNVGLLDADVYGPSIPTMLGLMDRPRAESGMLLPLEKFGMKIMSFGFFIEGKQALIWRGPLVSKTLKQLLDDVMWGDLDCLVVDLPPGTGDPSITVAQSIPSVSVVMVTTPQEVALADVRKAVCMFRDMNIRIAGIVENMSYFIHGDSEERIEIFGSGGGATLSRESGIPLLGSIPIDLGLRKGGDSGIPLMYDAPNSDTGEVFKGIARKMISLSAISRKAVA
ncbi:MAG: Mrp/NBP35 family ATP-binding protein [Deltaproteobacteria bacterium]|jgi:ATP-binding protein involved in chromosome partitioning|nr:Mrp/NBP35 family ATP-binding protein [Deltaproteobacteria bacterium]